MEVIDALIATIVLVPSISALLVAAIWLPMIAGGIDWRP